MNPQPGVPVQQQQPGWFSRNWKWLVGLGCLLPIMCCGIFGAVTYFTVTKVIQNSGVYAKAVPMAITDPDVVAALGAPVAPGMMLQGSVNETNGRGTADLSIPLEGSKAKGTLKINATKPSSNADWEFQVLEVEAGGKTINLLKGGGAPPMKGAPPDDAPPDEEPAKDDKPE